MVQLTINLFVNFKRISEMSQLFSLLLWKSLRILKTYQIFCVLLPVMFPLLPNGCGILPKLCQLLLRPTPVPLPLPNRCTRNTLSFLPLHYFIPRQLTWWRGANVAAFIFVTASMRWGERRNFEEFRSQIPEVRDECFQRFHWASCSDSYNQILAKVSKETVDCRAGFFLRNSLETRNKCLGTRQRSNPEYCHTYGGPTS